MDTKKTLMHLVMAAETALDTDNALTRIGYSNTPYFGIFGHLSDAIYFLVGEKTDKFEDSVTHKVLYNDFLSIDERVQVLLHEHEIHIAQDYIDGKLNK